MARSSPGADFQFVEVRYRIIDVSLRSELHNSDYLAIFRHNVGLNRSGSAIVACEILEILPRSLRWDILDNHSVAASARAVSHGRAPPGCRTATSSVGRASPAATTTASACGFDSDASAAEPCTVHFLNAIICISWVVENEEGESRFHCDVIWSVLPEEV